MSEEKRVLLSKKAKVITTVTIIVIVGILVAWLLVSQNNAKKEEALAKSDSPSYQTILPNGRSIEVLGGWERISPEGTEPVYAYSDGIEGVAITVSEQPIPESFKTDVTGKVAELAEKFNATANLDVDGTKVYLGTSAKGPQSLIFTRDGLLILIKSQQKVEDAAWKRYIQSLTSPLNARF